MDLTQGEVVFQDLEVTCGPFGPPLRSSGEAVMLAPHHEI